MRLGRAALLVPSRELLPQLPVLAPELLPLMPALAAELLPVLALVLAPELLLHLLAPAPEPPPPLPVPAAAAGRATAQLQRLLAAVWVLQRQTVQALSTLLAVAEMRRAPSCATPAAPCHSFRQGTGL